MSMYNVVTREVRNNWNNYLANRPHIEFEKIEDVVNECQPLASGIRLARPLRENAKAYEHPEIQSHYFIVKEEGDERVFISMQLSRPPIVADPAVADAPVPVLGVEPDTLLEKVVWFKDKMILLDNWLHVHRGHRERPKVALVKERLVEKLMECKVEPPADASAPFYNERGKLQYEAALKYLLVTVMEQSVRIQQLEAK